MTRRSDSAKHTARDSGREAASSDIILVARLVAASVIFAVSLIVKMPDFVSVILLVLAAGAAGYDIVLQAVSAVENKDYFATALVVVVITVLSYVIGFAVEGAALVILYQVGLLLIAYTEEKTKRSAMELLKYQDEETVGKMDVLLKTEGAGTLELEATMRDSAGSVLKLAMIFALVYAIALPLFTSYTYTVSIHRALTIILIATPVSVVTAMPLSGLVGMCYSAQQGVIFGSARTMEDAGRINVAVFDKAGIFTEEAPRVLSVQSDVLDEATFMTFAAHAVYYSDQPFAKAISALGSQEYKLDIISDFVDIPGYGVDLKIGGSQVCLATSALFSGRGVYVPQDENDTGQTLYMTVSDKYVGKLVLASDLKADSADIAAEIKDLGIKRCILLTEDGNEESQDLAEELGFSEVYGQCDTVKKLKMLKDLSEDGGSRIMYVYSNGIESHSAADIDVRVSRKAKYADITVLPDYASNIPFALQVCRRVREVATENAVFAFVIKAVLIFLSIVGYCNVWFAIFIDMAATLATQLNCIRVTNESLIRTLRFKAGK